MQSVNTDQQGSEEKASSSQNQPLANPCREFSLNLGQWKPAHSLQLQYGQEVALSAQSSAVGPVPPQPRRNLEASAHRAAAPDVKSNRRCTKPGDLRGAVARKKGEALN